MTKDEARKELLETLEEYCHDKGYGLQTFAGLSDLVYTLYPLKKTMTNADKIRSMTDKELAKWLDIMADCNISCPAKQTCFELAGSGTLVRGCVAMIKAWLQQEYKEG